MCKISKTQTSYNRTPSPLYRNKKKICAEAFSAKLDQELGNLVANKFPLSRSIFDDVFDQFVNIIEKTINKHAPLERMSRKQRKLARKRWITKGILTPIRKKNSMFRTHFITGYTVEKKFFRRYSNMLTKTKFLFKKIYYYSEFASNKKNLHKTWEIIRSVLPHKSTLEPQLALKVNDHITDDPNTIANQFNNYFCTIGSNLADTINSETTKKPTDFFKKKISDSIYLDPPSTNEVLNQITSLQNKAVGHDNIQPFFLKAARHVVAPYLSL